MSDFLRWLHFSENEFSAIEGKYLSVSYTGQIPQVSVILITESFFRFSFPVMPSEKPLQNLSPKNGTF